MTRIIHRPEEALDIQSELTFVDVMVHLPHEGNFDTPTTLPSPATPPSSLTATSKVTFSRTWCHTFNIPTYKIITTRIECATVLWANITHVTCGYKADEGVPCYSRLINRCLAPPSRVKLFLRNHKTLNSKEACELEQVLGVRTCGSPPYPSGWPYQNGGQYQC